MADGKRRRAGGDSGRAPRASLSAGRIAAAALKLIDSDGPDAFSMRKLGNELGADPMAVYHYFPNKAAIFDAVVETVFTEIDTSGEMPDRWDEAVVAAIFAARTAMRRHPRALPLLATRPVNTPPVFALTEVVAARLARAGASPVEALGMVNCLATFTIGHLLADVGDPVGGPEGPPPDAATLNIETIPTLAAAVAGGWVFDADGTFEVGLRAMIAGFGSRYGLVD